MVNYIELLFCLSALIFAAILSFIIIIISFTANYPIVKRTKKELEYYNPATDKYISFPSIDDEPTKDLSVIIPAYNEENRLPPMLEECLEFLEKRCTINPNFSYEIIVVNDGSADSTSKIVDKFVRKYKVDKIRLLELEKNRGKGGAVRLGMQSARGSVLLFADADGATKFADIVKLEGALNKLSKVEYLNNAKEASERIAIAIGSRAHLEQEVIANRNIFRTFLMYGFHFLVYIFAVKKIRDTQCGFKLFTRRAARQCFSSIHVERWAFDVELLYIAETLGIPVEEIAVQWTEIDGSKLVPIWSWLEMAIDLSFIWLRYLVGAWKIKAAKTD